MLTADVLESIPGIRHGFFTRRGGVSEGIYASLNCGLGSRDDRIRVVENRERAMGRLGVSSGALVGVYQVHSPRVVRVEGPWEMPEAPRADAMVSDRPGMALGILTADCAPVLLADPEGGVVGAAHAGWKGAHTGVLEAVVQAMIELGARADRIVAGVGPCIQQESYEVGPEFQAAFVDGNGVDGGYFRIADRAGHFLFDLSGYVRDRLNRLDLGAVAVLANDTRAEEDLFFSYRRATKRGEPDYGRCLSAICLKG